MKRISTIWTLALMAVLSISMMSCQDDDERLSYYLDGVWQGTITDDRQSYSTTIEFIQDSYYASRGYGYEIDDGWAYGRRTQTSFDWWVQGGCIYLRYSDTGRYIVMDYDWLPGSDRRGEVLRGRFIDYDAGYDMADFYLQKTYNHDEYYMNSKENKVKEDEE